MAVSAVKAQEGGVQIDFDTLQSGIGAIEGGDRILEGGLTAMAVDGMGDSIHIQPLAAAAYCGNGVREGGEACDGSDSGGATCQSAGFSSGALGCTSTCALDTSFCAQNVLPSGGTSGVKRGGGHRQARSIMQGSPSFHPAAPKKVIPLEYKVIPPTFFEPLSNFSLVAETYSPEPIPGQAISIFPSHRAAKNVDMRIDQGHIDDLTTVRFDAEGGKCSSTLLPDGVREVFIIFLLGISLGTALRFKLKARTRKQRKRKPRFAPLSRRTMALILLLAFLAMILGILPVFAATVPDHLSYEGRILDSSRNPVTSGVVLRFSFWKSADWTAGDASGGSINTGATNYGEWYEVQTITPSSNGIIQVQLGTATALPTLDFTKHKYLQVETKFVGQPDTSYVLLDPTGDGGADTVDRKAMASVPYAKNAESVGNRTIGTASGNILLLGPDGKIRASQVGSGTTSQSFMINTDSAAGDTTLTFGNALLPESLKFSGAAHRFEFSTGVQVKGDLSIANGGALSASGSIATEGGLTLNKDNTASDATLTFGSNLGVKTLKYSTTNQKFEFNDSVSVQGNLTVSGLINGISISETAITPLSVSAGAGLSINVAAGNYRLGGTLTNFTGSSGIVIAASATRYVFFGSGGLTIRAAAFPTDESFIPLALVTTSTTAVTSIVDKRTLQGDTREYDNVQVLTPEYDKVSYKGDGSNNVGVLSVGQDSPTKRNFYLWTSTRSTLQDYDVYVRVALPRDFVGWETGDGVYPLELQYRSTSALSTDNALDVSVYDTSGNAVTLSGTSTGLASTSWATTSINFLGSPVWTPGDEFLIKLRLSAMNTFEMHLGSIKLRSTHLTGQ